MQFLAICAVLLCSTAIVLADLDDNLPCDTDMDCKTDECCVLSFLGDIKVCRELGDDQGDLCGGRYFCPICQRNLECVPEPQGNELHGCAHPANGTCLRRRRPGF